MAVSPDNVMCRFINPMHWSAKRGGPREGAFKPEPPDERKLIVGLSVWDEGELHRRGTSRDDLLIDGLAGFGKVSFTVAEFGNFARQTSDPPAAPFGAQVERRTKDKYVDPPWRPWQYAHCQVEATEGPSLFTGRFRKLLVANAKCRASPPAKFAAM
jgi:hypothetical protein